ncbi:unnamed protein product [Cuscuta campestris]|uniref:Uncharacterized protein n=1 Tax=Cuscuta campestris TaxID=132261 RepID=A0A484LID2_9ASTE|nr:unnamed protein product [Cuscuta campestris]
MISSPAAAHVSKHQRKKCIAQESLLLQSKHCNFKYKRYPKPQEGGYTETDRDERSEIGNRGTDLGFRP